MTPANELNRRRFLTGAVAAGAAVGTGALAGLGGPMLEPRRRGSLDDIEHVVVLMQENRSFDHYYGTLRGVRGFADAAAVPGVFAQPNPKGGHLLPFHVDTHRVDGQRLADLDHSWDGTHAAWNGGAYDGWVGAKTELTMAHFTEADVPFHHALADAFTICDHYFCSLQGPTTPNRLYLFSGTIDPSGLAGGPAIGNPTDYQPVFSWTTYPERLQAAGVSWRVYANREVGDGTGEDGYLGDYGDNPLWLFHAYHEALASTDPARRELAERASVHDGWLPSSGKGRDVNHVLADFLADCRSGALPRVSYVVAPYAYCEHPRARPVDGASYVHTVLRALFDNPSLWASTAVFLNYDENDGFFDHVLPPVPASGTELEFVGGRPIGLGPRVPMTVISPWSRGGWVNSEVHDHTSVIRFLERWTGVREPNISAWRRAVTGDLTSAFDFREHDTTIPLLPDTTAMRARVDALQSTLPPPVPPPLEDQHMPAQSPGTRPARALPYQPSANATISGGMLTVTMRNAGDRSVQLAVAAPGQSPTSHLVGAGGQVDAQVTLPFDARQAVGASGGPGAGKYQVTVHGPNGFLRVFGGGASAGQVEARVELVGAPAEPVVRLTVDNAGGSPARVSITDLLGSAEPRSVAVPEGQAHAEDHDVLATRNGWYDLSVGLADDPAFTRRFAGHLENGGPSRSGPA